TSTSRVAAPTCRPATISSPAAGPSRSRSGTRHRSAAAWHRAASTARCRSSRSLEPVRLTAWAALGWLVPASQARPDAQLRPDTSRVTAFVGVSVVPMDRERVLEGQTVVVRGGRVVGIGPVATTAVPTGAIRVDGRGKYLLPGL